jgi:hypothetical protein
VWSRHQVYFSLSERTYARPLSHKSKTFTLYRHRVVATLCMWLCGQVACCLVCIWAAFVATEGSWKKNVPRVPTFVCLGTQQSRPSTDFIFSFVCCQTTGWRASVKSLNAAVRILQTCFVFRNRYVVYIIEINGRYTEKLHTDKYNEITNERNYGGTCNVTSPPVSYLESLC